MGTFLRKTAIALLIALLLHAAAGLLADGTTDEYYLRFTTPKQRSMILGGSRAAQGLHPSVFNNAGGTDGLEGPLYNFSFTMAHSPYGETYLHAIKEKLDPTVSNGLFILQVDPWLLSIAGSGPVEPEADRALGQQHTWSPRPNYEYLARYWDSGWGALGHWPKGDPDTTAEVLPDGRLQVHVPMDPATVLRRTAEKVRTYRDEYLPGRGMSAYRFHWLKSTIELLRPHGTVVLVRLPVCEAIANMEDSLATDFFGGWTDFDRSMEALRYAFDPPPNFEEEEVPTLWSSGIHYIQLDTMVATFTDGNHLDEASGIRVSEALRQAIQRASATGH